MEKRFFSFVLIFAITFSAFAADKPAYINMEKIFEGYYKTVQENFKFELQKQDFEERHSLMREEYDNSVKEAQRTDADMKNELLSQEAREDSRRKLALLMERLQVKRDELMRFRQEGMQNLQGVRAEAEEGLIIDLSDLIKAYAKEKGYTHVYEVSGRSLNRVPFLFVYPEELEITDEILSYVNRGHETELQEAKSKLDAAKKKSAELATDPTGL
jgi:Skp family chaperone for outer membrane proteins